MLGETKQIASLEKGINNIKSNEKHRSSGCISSQTETKNFNAQGTQVAPRGSNRWKHIAPICYAKRL